MIDFTQTDQHDEPSELVGLLSDSALRRASNATIFARGRAYAASGAVAVTSDVPGNTPTTRATIRATVTGTEPYSTEPYSTEVWIHDGQLGGDCSCANGQDGYYCKHHVALALIWRDRLSGVTNEPDGQVRDELLASAPRMHGANDRRAALRGFLNGQSAAVLADRLLDLADRDGSIERELQQWRKLSEAPQDAADLNALVSDIMSPGTDFIAWQEGYGYARRAEAVLPLLEKTRSCQTQ